MSYLNRVFAARFMKTLLVVWCIGLLIAAIWFLGPFFGFGVSRPLQRIESRVVFILLAVFCLTCFWLRWPLFISITATLCVLVWIVGPFLLVGEKHPLTATGIRLAIIGVVLVCALLYGLWLLLLAIKDNPALLDKFIRHKTVKKERDPHEISAAIARAVDYVNKRHGNLSFFQRVILARKPLDRLPWYMVLGTENAGKTSAILASGQDFPVPDQLNQVSKPATKTESCECWLANDAIYVDTAGKYVSDPDASINEWRAVLKTLKKYRPVKALNGVIVAISAADFLGRTQAELFELAASLRGRIDDIRQTLGVRFPLYVLVTKVDQLPGFAEYFRMLTEQEREQVWGVTFPYGDTKTLATPELQSQIKAEFALLQERIERDIIVRQQEEYANRDRKKMYGLPQDFHQLSEHVADVVHHIVFASRYDESQNYTLLRGIYFCSSHQPVGFSLLNNRTIIRQWQNYVENRSPVVSASLIAQPQEHDFLVGDVSYGRQYFLRSLFRDVIVNDRGLARHNLANESKFRLQRFLGHTFSLMLAVVLLNGLWHSYQHNSDYLSVVEEKVGTLSSEVRNVVKSPADNLLPRLLTLSQYLPEYGSLALFNPPLAWRYGLYTGGDVIEASDSLYQFFLQRLLLPQIEQQVSLALQDAIDSGQSEHIFRSLKIYLQVYGQGTFDKSSMIAAITHLWESTGKLQPYEERRIFVAHLNRLFDSTEWRRYGQRPDAGLVKYARAMLERDDLASRLYERIKYSVMQDAPADLTLNTMAKSRGSELFTRVDKEGVTAIPGLFTRAGYYDVFKKKMESGLIWLQREDAWVSGKTDQNGSEEQSRLSTGRLLVNPLQEQILKRYLDEYANYWQGFLSNIGLRTDLWQQDDFNTGGAGDIYMLRVLSASDSPLANLLNRAVSETTLVSKEKTSLIGKASDKGQILSAAAKVNLAYAALEKKSLQERVDDQFEPLRVFVTGRRERAAEISSGGGEAGLNKLLGSLNEQYTLLVVYEDALKNGNTMAVSRSARVLGAEAQTWPDPLPAIIAPLIDGAWHRAHREAIAKSNENIEESIGQACRTTLQGRYPFAQSQREVKIADFERFFAPGGVADDYFKTHLADKVDTSKRPWRYKGDTDENESALTFFEKAAEIRHLFFQEEGSRLSLHFDVSIPYLDPSITQLNMNFDGKQVNYAHWPVLPVSVLWPASRMTSRVTLNAMPRITPGNSAMSFSGPWALFRWMDHASDVRVTQSGEMQWVYELDSRRANIGISGLTYKDRPLMALLQDFRCPGDD